MIRARPCLALALALAPALALFLAGCGGDAPAPGPSAVDRHGLDAACDPNAPGLAAHLSHAGTAARAALSCLECHGPCDGAPASAVTFGSLARADGATPTWSAATRTCSGVYCHGATGATPTAPVAWAYVDPTRPRPLEEACSTCHGYPPPPPHEARTSCHDCHPDSVNADGTVDVAGGHHVDGRLDVACNACHSFPPTTGAHVVHAGPPVEGTPPLDDLTLEDRYPDASPTEAPSSYAFGCGTCHDLDPALHGDGKVDLALGPEGATPGTLRALAAPGAAFDRDQQVCFGTYCHSSGQEFPAYVVSPPWTSGQNPGCAGCHANPPSYPSGGAGAADANSHVNLADDGYEFGHFLGVPGVWHTSKHGSPGAAPITCQACHFDTVDPANVAAGGFYYLDTTGRYQLPGGDPGRIDWGWTTQLDCTSCHTGAPGAPPQGAGRILPLRHVNGRRDVVFDPRTTLSSVAGLPPPPNTPTKPYWTAQSARAVPWPASAVWSGTTVSFDLTAAHYDAQTKTCSAVGCHLADVPTWGKPYGYGSDWQNCNLCHPM